MVNLVVLEGEIEKYRNLLSKAESQETIEVGLAEEIANFEISFESRIKDNQGNFTEIIELEKYVSDKIQEDLDLKFSKFKEYIESGKPIEDIIDKYSIETLEDLELRLSNSIKQEELYIKYFELQEKRIDIDSEKGFKIHRIRYELDNGYKQELDNHRLMDEWEKQAKKVYETEPEGMYG